MSTGLAKMSAMLSGKMMPLVEAIELHEVSVRNMVPTLTSR
jgi:hypothetical protein